MEICIAANGYGLRNLLNSIDFAAVHILAVITELNEENKTILTKKGLLGKIFDFTDVEACLKTLTTQTYFLIATTEYEANVEFFSILRRNNVPKEKIIGAWIFSHDYMDMISYANVVKYIIENDVEFDFLTTGISYLELGLDLDALLPYKGVNLGVGSQDLYYSYKMAQYVLARNKKFKFILIGLAPYSFQYDMEESVYSCRVLQYYIILKSGSDKYPNNEVIETIFNNRYKLLYNKVPKKLIVDLNDRCCRKQDLSKNNFTSTFKERLLLKDYARKIAAKDYPVTLSRNIYIMEKFVLYCKKNAVVPIGVVVPFSKQVRLHYPIEALHKFRCILKNLEEEYNFKTIDLFDIDLPDEYFFDSTHLNIQGSLAFSLLIKDKLEDIL